MIAASSSAKSIASLESVKSLRTFKLDTLRSDLFDAHSVIRTGLAAVTHRRREKKRAANAKTQTATAPEPNTDSQAPAGPPTSSSATSIASSKSLDTFRLDMLSRAGCDARRTLEAGLAAHRRRDKKRSVLAKTAPATGKPSTLETTADDPAARRVPAMTSEEMIRSLRLKLHQMRTGFEADINASQ